MDKHEAKQCLGILLGYISAHDPSVKITGQTAGNIAAALKCVLEELEGYEKMTADASSIRLGERTLVRTGRLWFGYLPEPIRTGFGSQVQFDSPLEAYQACKEHREHREHREQSDG